MKNIATEQMIDLHHLAGSLKEQVSAFLDKYAAYYPGKPPTETEVLSDIVDQFHQLTPQDYEHRSTTTGELE